nr:hypothetical protein [Desulfobulbaceae bacterium]
MSRPFRAICTIPVPRALPWAGMFWPFQGKPNIYDFSSYVQTMEKLA